MKTDLNLQLFTNVSEDFEKRQYLVLGSLRQFKDEFKNNKLYPYLAQLIELQRNLNKLVQGFNAVRNDGPKKIKKVDLVNKRIEFESVLPKQVDLTAVEELIRWAMPLIRETIEEGITIYEFVEENLSIENIGIEPQYNAEGYAFVPDAKNGSIHLFRYEMSILTSPEERYRTLKTTFIKTLESSVQKPLNTIKLDLIREFKELPNPATYSIFSEMDFPFDETMLPVSKRKLLHRIAV